MRPFNHVTPGFRLFAGAESLRSLGRELDRLGSRRAVIFCPRSLARDLAAIDLVRAAMGNRCAGVFDGVRAHSPLPDVRMGAEKLRELSADAIVVVGGGSAVVTARAASILLAEGDDIRAICTHHDGQGKLVSPKLAASKLPNVVIPTTPNTGIPKAGSAVFDPADGSRLALFDPKSRASSVFIHPDFVRSAPKVLFVNAALDTLTQSIEGLMSREGDPLSDALLIHATRLLRRYLVASVEEDESAGREEAVMAAVMCGQGTDSAGVGVANVLGHALVGHTTADNGVSKMIMLPHALRFYREAGAAGFSKLAAAFDIRPSDGPDLVLEALDELAMHLGVPRGLHDVGVSREDLPKIAEKSMGDWFLRGSPRPVTHASELISLLEKAW